MLTLGWWIQGSLLFPAIFWTCKVFQNKTKRARKNLKILLGFSPDAVDPWECRIEGSNIYTLRNSWPLTSARYPGWFQGRAAIEPASVCKAEPLGSNGTSASSLLTAKGVEMIINPYPIHLVNVAKEHIWKIHNIHYFPYRLLFSLRASSSLGIGFTGVWRIIFYLCGNPRHIRIRVPNTIKTFLIMCGQSKFPNMFESCL